MFDDIETEPDPLQQQMEGFFMWLEEDYGGHILSLVTIELMKASRENPDMKFEDVVYNVSLDWSK